jgi:hypothetical protein
MSLTKRGRLTIGLLILLIVIAGGVGVVMALGGVAEGPSAGGNPPAGGSGGQTTPPPPPECPLSGVNPETAVPARPALAVKVENLPAARPQTGLSWADIVYEEPVEGGITRFIAVYQCQNASRIQPIRSGRLTDVDVLVQFGQPLFAYAGGQGPVIQAVRKAGIIDINYNVSQMAGAYHRDVNRSAPHNLYSSTKQLYSAATGLYEPTPPEPLFTYSDEAPAAAVKARRVHVPFSFASDVFWKWSKTKKAWIRFHGTDPHVSSDGTQFSAKNVIVQLVQIKMTDLTDAAGARSPRAISVGSGKAYVFRDGKVIKGTWERDSSEDLTRFLDENGEEIPLARGNTWIELLPRTISITIR